ncbi:hypothetical protein ABG79_00321 [Caloramator mitchellensis]|uniref:DUF2344 domain-containing protein n=1 Tax=Caloramator mitchellensis TaxID=908809 RepID=A0A0R3JX82_CALMK|nr:TIGR03936 family radical SAM-associated protein [Caloramator mitchellensis]KRQ88151.1 hypothetical protein ABG79_00321 [Caloramator mitchellensis]
MERYLIKFQKIGNIKFLSHLDTLRTLHRAFKRANLPISYSKGFNPHPAISVASPLSVGIESFAEYADIELNDYVEKDEIINKLNQQLPDGFNIVNAIHIKKKAPAAMAAIYAAEYRLIFSQEIKLETLIEEIINSQEIQMMKRSKSGERLVNVRPFIYNLELIDINDKKVLKALLQNSNQGSLNPDLLIEVIKQKVNKDIGYVKIIRTEMYANNNELVDFISYFSKAEV